MQEYIEECLESVMRQTYKDIEIICINDFSMDNSMTIVKDLAKKDNRIKIIHNEKNRGLGGARNEGLDAAQGEYIIFVDTDDKINPTMAEDLLSSLLENNADMVFCDVALLDNDLSTRSCRPLHDEKLFKRKNKTFDVAHDYELFFNSWPSAWNKIYKKSIIDKCNIRYLENILYEDHTFYYEYILACKNIFYLEKPLYIYRHQRDGSIMKVASPRIFEIFTILDKIEEILKEKMSTQKLRQVMCKISVRLLWERTLYLDKKLTVCKKFVKKAKKYLEKYSYREILKNKDAKISKDEKIIKPLWKVVAHKIFRRQLRRDDIKYTILFVTFTQKDKLRRLQSDVTWLCDQLWELKQEINKSEENIDEHR